MNRSVVITLRTDYGLSKKEVDYLFESTDPRVDKILKSIERYERSVTIQYKPTNDRFLKSVWDDIQRVLKERK